MTWLLFIGKILFVLLAIWGLVSLGHTVVRWMLRSVSQKERDFFLVVCVQGHDEEIEYLLRQLLSHYQGDRIPLGRYQILCLDRGMDSETRTICEKMAKQYPMIRIVEGILPKEISAIVCKEEKKVV